MDELIKWRSEVIESAINIEWLLNAIICQHYLKKLYKNFLLEVLYDEYFNFGLKRRILQKIVPDEPKRNIDKLNRLNTIRNYFAHCNQRIAENKYEEGIVPDPRNLKETVDFKQLHQEFMVEKNGIEIWLSNIFRKEGGILEEAIK